MEWFLGGSFGSKLKLNFLFSPFCIHHPHTHSHLFFFLFLTNTPRTLSATSQAAVRLSDVTACPQTVEAGRSGCRWLVAPRIFFPAGSRAKLAGFKTSTVIFVLFFGRSTDNNSASQLMVRTIGSDLSLPTRINQRSSQHKSWVIIKTRDVPIEFHPSLFNIGCLSVQSPICYSYLPKWYSCPAHT